VKLRSNDSVDSGGQLGDKRCNESERTDTIPNIAKNVRWDDALVLTEYGGYIGQEKSLSQNGGRSDELSQQKS